MNGDKIPAYSTPVIDSKKRELSSPLDNTDLNKMAEFQIVLSSEDITVIANLLKESFRSEIPSHRPAANIDTNIQAIVAGLQQKLEKENGELPTRVDKLERDADSAEQ